MQREIAAIHNDLHCNAITIFGTNRDRLIEGAEIALAEGLEVWIQPRPIDADQEVLLVDLTEVARAAERRRREYGNVSLNVGVELTLFSKGIIPGETFEERIQTLLDTVDELQGYNEGLNRLLARANETARAEFQGPVTYGSGSWEGVDWSDFDCVGVDLYLDAYSRPTYIEDLRALHRHGKPVVITEFGCCTYESAEDAGGSGYEIVDWEKTPPELNGEYVRSEEVQAGTIGELLDIYGAEDVHGAFVYTWVEPEMTYSPEARFDLDMASFGIVKTLPKETGKGYEETGYWEPKLAFAEIARRYGES